MTLNDWAYSIMNQANPAIIDDYEIDIRQVKEWILDYRVTFLKNILDSGKRIDPSITQTIPNLKLEFVKTGYDKSRIFRTKESIPDIISLKYRSGLLRVGPTDLTIPSYRITDNLSEVPFLGNSRFNQHMSFSYITGGHINIKTKDPLFPIEEGNEISVTAVFTDPRELHKFLDENGKPIYSDVHIDFPMSKEMKTYIDKTIIREKFRVVESSITDRENNAADDSQRRAQAYQPAEQSYNEEQGEEG